MSEDKKRIAELEKQAAQLRTELEETYRSITELTNELALKNESLEEANKKVAKLAGTDELTGLNNRRCLMESLEKEVQRCKRYHFPLSLCILDLDYFKRINDTHGHQIGDKILEEVGSIICETIRDTDFSGRYGGEEFIVVFTNTSLQVAQNACERLRKAFSEKTYTAPQGRSFQVTCSIGVAKFNEQAADVDTVLKAADEALYNAKSKGRNRVCSANMDLA